MIILIGAFAQKTGISAHTLRYYEKEGLLKPGRDGNGRRCFTGRDAEWVAFIKRLKETGMPIRDIREYARLREQGEATLTPRKALLEQHREKVKRTLAQWAEHLASLERKIEFYETEIGRNAPCRNGER